MNHSTQIPKALPTAWVERLFRKLTLTYGRDFMARWEGLDECDVIEDWAEELAGFVNHPEALAYALKHLPPGKPPTVIEFCAIANRCPPPVFAALPAPVADPVVVAEIMAKAKAVTKPQMYDPKQWARDILTRHQAGDKLPPINVQFARQALGART